ncbi:GNAT family N-acetyltransferase [Lysinibacillus sp. 2017]|uniref:GNAT family N-acetyltransferase n=1 Tax=unclassified Lysinibacillus TaxID=2636778 RepID=UPI000D5289B4|nr:MULTISPECIES: GNAT family N-acetyltransferase [unclassified Lysinibacillus]AWE07207.1 GNAT family N-acetyltransferase [Lysinibacillus sp. 2017]TGN34665.1 N-acetyltransferase [Lysinibacillus sp. S2017]
MENKNLLMIKHSQLESERVLLRPISLDDAEDMYEYHSDEETTRFIFDQHKDLVQTKNMMANYYLKEPIGKYAIVLKESSKMIGIVEFRVHEHNQNGEFGFTLNRQFWGNGYMTEACKPILDLAFNVLGLERVYAEHDVRNPASGKVLIRLGMTCDGILRKNHMVKGFLTDSAHYSILKEEFKNLSKNEQ